MKIKFKKKYLFILIPLVIGGVVYFNLSKKPAVQYVTAKAYLGNLVQTVSESGTVKTAKQLDLNFLASGKIAKQNVKIGDKVKKDQILAELDYSNLTIQARQSSASLQSANANLSKIINGASSQDLAISQTSVNQAQTAYSNSKIDLTNTEKSTTELINQATKNLNDLQSGLGSDVSAQQQAVNSAKTNLDNAISTNNQAVSNRQSALLTTINDKLSVAKTALDAANRVITDQDAKDTLSIQDLTQLSNAKSNYQLAQDSIIKANTSIIIAKATLAQPDINQAGFDTSDMLAKTLNTLNFTFSALEKSVASAIFTQTKLDTFKTSISGQLALVNGANTSYQAATQALSDAILAQNTNIAAAQNSLNQAQTAFNNTITAAKNSLTNARLSANQQIASAKSRVDANYNSWRLAQNQLDKLRATPRTEDIKLAQAQVASAQAALDAINNQINNSIIKSPINGQVTKLNYEIGEQPTVTQPVVSVLTEDNFEIDIDISESDITKVKQSNKAAITFDALGEDTKFVGEVIFIEPAQTVIQDVVYYKTTIGNIHPLATTTDSNSELVDSLTATSSASTDVKATSSSSTIFSIANLIKPGMTANVILTTDTEENVLIVPDRAIIINPDFSKIVRVLENNASIDKPVITGLKGDEGLTQIISGLKDGDTVITSIKNAATP